MLQGPGLGFLLPHTAFLKPFLRPFTDAGQAFLANLALVFPYLSSTFRRDGSELLQVGLTGFHLFLNRMVHLGLDLFGLHAGLGGKVGSPNWSESQDQHGTPSCGDALLHLP
jgi:hypothetical protein